MFITNIAEFNNKYFYICDKQKSDEFIKNGFCLLGIEDDGYYYFKTEKLNKYLSRQEGVKCVEHRTDC